MERRCKPGLLLAFAGAALLACTAGGSSSVDASPDAGPMGAGMTGSAGSQGEAGAAPATGADASLGTDAAAEDAGALPALRGPLETCTEPVGSCPARSIGIWGVLLDAADFGVDARLIAAGAQAALVDAGADGFRVVLLRRPAESADSVPEYAAWEFPSGALRPIDVVGDRLSKLAPPPLETLIVLACDQARVRCSIWRAEVSAGAPLAWQETSVPAGLVPAAVALDTAVEPHAVCVYGNGMLCYQDGWHEAIGPSADLDLNQVAFGANWSLAVGEGGRWFVRERDASGALSAWREQAALGAAALSHASVEGGGGVITGGGRIQASAGSQADAFDCGPPGEVIAFLLSPGVRGLGYALTAGGQIYQHALLSPRRLEPYCAYQQLDAPGAVLEVASAPCDAAMNPRVLTERAWIGTNLCLSI